MRETTPGEGWCGCAATEHGQHEPGFPGGLVFTAKRLLYHSTLGSSVVKKKKSPGRESDVRTFCVGRLSLDARPKDLLRTCIEGYKGEEEKGDDEIDSTPLHSSPGCDPPGARILLQLRNSDRRDHGN